MTAASCLCHIVGQQVRPCPADKVKNTSHFTVALLSFPGLMSRRRTRAQQNKQGVDISRARHRLPPEPHSTATPGNSVGIVARRGQATPRREAHVVPRLADHQLHAHALDDSPSMLPPKDPVVVVTDASRAQSRSPGFSATDWEQCHMSSANPLCYASHTPLRPARSAGQRSARTKTNAFGDSALLETLGKGSVR